MGFCFIQCVITCYFHYFDVQLNSDLVSRIPLKLTPVSSQCALVIFWEHILTFWLKMFVTGPSFPSLTQFWNQPLLQEALISFRLGIEFRNQDLGTVKYFKP